VDGHGPWVLLTPSEECTPPTASTSGVVRVERRYSSPTPRAEAEGQEGSRNAPQFDSRTELYRITGIDWLADLLTILVSGGQPVMDMTGVKGRYQVVLEIPAIRVGEILNQARDAGADPNADLAAARQKLWQSALQKVGLHLEPRKGSVETIVVDHVEKNPTAN
jgi:uncharacterized protein (TIGR03435 family)